VELNGVLCIQHLKLDHLSVAQYFEIERREHLRELLNELHIILKHQACRLNHSIVEATTILLSFRPMETHNWQVQTAKWDRGVNSVKWPGSFTRQGS
jgi:hypothetical protein